MAVRRVIYKTCDRCGKDEEVSSETQSSGAILSLEFGNVSKTYKDLCKRCKDRVTKLANDIFMAKKEEGA